MIKMCKEKIYEKSIKKYFEAVSISFSVKNAMAIEKVSTYFVACSYCLMIGSTFYVENRILIILYAPDF